MAAAILAALLGFFIFAYIFFQFLYFTYKIFRWYILTNLGFVKDLTKYGEWAVVTGATDGIGKEYARQLAKQGFKILLISRTKEKLEEVMIEIMDEFNVDVKCIAFDFTKAVGYEEISQVIQVLDVGILVNNVAMSDTYKPDYSASDINSTKRLLNCNILSDVKMTHIVSKGMKERQRGAILHISTIGVFTDFPRTVYISTKEFMGRFCRSLQLEDTTVHHQLVTPAFVSTKMSKTKPAFMIPTAEGYVKWAIRTIGIAEDTCGYPIHEVQRAITSLLPTSVVLFILRRYKREERKGK